MTRGVPPSFSTASEFPLTSTSTRSASVSASARQTRAGAASKPLGPGVSSRRLRKFRDSASIIRCLCPRRLQNIENYDATATMARDSARNGPAAGHFHRAGGPRTVYNRPPGAAAPPAGPAAAGGTGGASLDRRHPRRPPDPPVVDGELAAAGEEEAGEAAEEDEVVLVAPLALVLEHEEAVLRVDREQRDQHLEEERGSPPAGQPADEQEQAAQELEARDQPGQCAGGRERLGLEEPHERADAGAEQFVGAVGQEDHAQHDAQRGQAPAGVPPIRHRALRFVP